MKISGIYKIQSKIKPNRIYIGSAEDINKRWVAHLSDLKRNKHRNGRLQNHYNKYGISDLNFSILLGCEKEDLLKVEQYFIDSYKPFFNICKTAGRITGFIHSEETKNKISRSLKGRTPWNTGKKLSEEHKRKVGLAGVGRKPSEKAVQKLIERNKARKGIPASPKLADMLRKMGGWNKGRKMSEDQKQKLREWHLGRKLSEETKHKLSLAGKGKKRSEKTCKKISEALKGKNRSNLYWIGRKHSEETKEKMRLAWIKRKQLLQINPN